jgi:hypothetical protein
VTRPAGIVVCCLTCALYVGALSALAAARQPMTVRIHVWGNVRFDRVERFAPDVNDTGCTLIRGYAPPGKSHRYSYTLTINEAGRHLHRDTLFLTVDPYRRRQTVYVGPGAGRVQLFTQEHGKAVVVSAYQGISGLRLRITLAPDLRSGTVEAANMHATNGQEVGLRASMTASWTCPVLFNVRYGSRDPSRLRSWERRYNSSAIPPK